MKPTHETGAEPGSNRAEGTYMLIPSLASLPTSRPVEADTPLIPKPGHLLTGHGDIRGTHCVALIVPYVQDGFYFITAISSDAKRNDGPGTMDFLTKAIRADHIGDVLDRCLPTGHAETLTWEHSPCEPWEYNELAYTDHQHYVDEAVLGRRAL